MPPSRTLCNSQPYTELGHRAIFLSETLKVDSPKREKKVLTQGSKSRYFNAPQERCGHVCFACVKLQLRCLQPVKLSESTWTSQDPMECVFRLQTTAAWSPRTSVSCTPGNAPGFHRNPRSTWLHLVLSAGRFGHPRLLGNWMDESDSRKLSLVTSTAAAHIWHKRILSPSSNESRPSASWITKKPKH